MGSSAEAKKIKFWKVPKAASSDVGVGANNTAPRGLPEQSEVIVNQTSPLVRTLGPVKPDTKE